MSVNRVGGHPDYGSSSASAYFPIVFSKKTQPKFYASSVLSEITTTEYLSDLKNLGDEVVMRVIPDISVKKYKKGGRVSFERPESTALKFSIDYAAAFGFTLNDLDRLQMDVDMWDKWTNDAAEQLRLYVEKHVLSLLPSDSDSSNIGSSAGKDSGNIDMGTPGTPLVLTRNNIIDKIVEIGQIMDEHNLPVEGRYLILPPWAQTLVKRSEISDSSLTGDSESPVRSGRIGQVDRVMLYASNLLPTTTDGGSDITYVLWGHKNSVAFVSQVNKVENERITDGFDNLLKGLMVYGKATYLPIGLGYMYAKNGEK